MLLHFVQNHRNIFLKSARNVYITATQLLLDDWYIIRCSNISNLCKIKSHWQTWQKRYQRHDAKLSILCMGLLGYEPLIDMAQSKHVSYFGEFFFARYPASKRWVMVEHWPCNREVVVRVPRLGPIPNLQFIGTYVFSCD